MVNLTFGEQVKIILSRKGMTIKELAEQVEKHTGKPMSRQNMTQRLGRDNFQEQDMRLIAQILGCKFTLSIMEMEASGSEAPAQATAGAAVVSRQVASEMIRDITIGELVDMAEEVVSGDEISEVEAMGEAEVESAMVEAIAVKEAVSVEPVVSAPVEKTALGQPESAKTKVDEREREILRKGISGYFKKAGTVSEDKSAAVKPETAVKKPEASKKPAEPILGEINPYTGKEYKTNSVRMHPKRIGYVQVYDAEQHKWTEMTEWAFLGYQERKKVLMGKDYVPPIYLD